MTDESAVTHVSETARWVAVHRAMETLRPDALFRDPLADRLAGARGREIAEAAAETIAEDWFLIARTRMIDDQVSAAVDAGCDAVVNLGAGLDTRPYRMALPAELRWIEADLPGLIAEKETMLADVRPRCRLTRAAVDVTDTAAVTALLDTVLVDVGKALVVAEGLVMYLRDTEVAGLAHALKRPDVAGWCLDFSAAGVASLLTTRHEGVLRHAPWTFLPEYGVTFFEEQGWQVAEVESILSAAGRLDRLTAPELRVAASGPEPDPRAPGDLPYSAVVRLT